MKKMKPKVAITIFLDQEDKIHFQATTKNLITILGMLELAREIATQKKAIEPDSPIVVPDFGNGRP